MNAVRPSTFFLKCGFFMVLLAVLLSVQVYADSSKLSLYQNEPVMDVGGAGSWDSAYIDPGAMVFHEDQFHMFYVGIPSWPHSLAIGYATSKDGVQWKRETDSPILTIEDTGHAGESINADSVIVDDNGQWMLFFSVGRRQTDFTGHIVRATSTSPLGPWKVDSAPALSRGPEGAWDSVNVGSANVVKTTDGYAMYYSGKGKFTVDGFSEEHENIGLATSKDGATWKKYNNPATAELLYEHSDPVMATLNDPSSWQSWSVRDPNVQATENGWKMIYAGSSLNSSGNYGVATSVNGVEWTRTHSEPVLQAKDIGKTISFITYVRKNQRDLIYIEAGSTSGTKIFLAVGGKTP